MRDAFSRCLVQAAKADSRVLLLTGDHGYALFDQFRKECPSQYINAGIAEQNMVGVAAGLAKVGFFPIVYGLSAFIPIRVLEQIKIDLCYERLPALLIGDGAGLVYSHLGTSHQSTEDIAALRGVPNVSIYSPADAVEMEWCFTAALSARGTCYLRMGKADMGRVHDPATLNHDARPTRVLGDGGEKTVFLATGSMLKKAQAIAQQLGGISVWSMPRIKPLSAEEIDTCVGNAEKVVTLEEHSIYGGLGSVVAERIAHRRQNLGTTLLRIGIDDTFSEICGNYEYLMDWHGLSLAKVEKKLRSFLEL
jgi:transketolase